MKNIFSKSIKIILKHKIIFLVVLLILLSLAYWAYSSFKNNNTVINYTTAKVEKGTITTFVSVSGQVSASNQVDIKSKVSENVVYVAVKNGQKVKAGTLLIQFDTANTQKSVRDAQSNLDSANLSLQKLKETNAFSLPKDKKQAEDNLTQSYQDAFTTISNAFLDLPTVMTGLQDVLFGTTMSTSFQSNIDYYAQYTQIYSDSALTYRDSANNSFQKSLTEYNKNFSDYKSITRNSSSGEIEILLNETYQTTKNVSDAVKDASNLIQFYKDKITAQGLKPSSIADTHLASLNTYTGKSNTGLSNLFNAINTIKNNKEAITSTNLNLQTADLDLQSQEISLQQKQNALLDAKANLSNCYVYAPYDGIVANLAVAKADAVSSGAVVATFITNQSITSLPFNEIDITKIKVGQKANLTFDAIDNLNIVGQVAEVATLGTVTQGVVNYNVKIIFDASESQVKPGMSISADIITAVKQDVFTLPNSAIKQNQNSSYVEVLINNAPVQKNVITGLTNDTSTEIISGLDGTEDVITQTNTTAKTTTTATSSANSAVRIPGVTGGGAGFRGN